MAMTFGFSVAYLLIIVINWDTLYMKSMSHYGPEWHHFHSLSDALAMHNLSELFHKGLLVIFF